MSCTALIVAIFEQFCCFDEVFLIALTSTEQLFIERPSYRHFLHNDYLLILFLVTCVKKFLAMFLLLQFSIFRSSHWRCSVRRGVLGNLTKFTGKNLWQSLFFNKVPGWSNCFWSFLCLLLKISGNLISTERWDKKGKYPDWVPIFTFWLEYRFVWHQRFQRNLADGNLIRKCV